ncbi:MAG TPA: gamma-glutamyl-gamma-aminobutyrate hydrolase family protein [bacterium]|nr:gamma-glutamyl-gamma-aminobutyrate hydrolase family protein [bacterium]
MAGKPCIAIPVPTLAAPEPGAVIIDHPASYCLRDYIEAVRIGGGYPFLLPILDDPYFLPDVMPYFHGLLLTGGADVHPARYGAAPHPQLQRVEPAQDGFELAALKLALEADLPILAICRGLQLLNVGLGGTLIQDIPSQVPNALPHGPGGVGPDRYHEITFTPDTPMAAWYTRPTIIVNSHHHQAIDTLGEGLSVAAVAPDGVIEAVELPDREFVKAVQWHPERMIAGSAEQLELFEQFIAATVRRAALGSHAI